MSELDRRITAWRRSVRRILSQRDDVLDELEGHLTEEVQSQMRAGHSLDDAFSTALSKLGQVDELAAEFRRIPAVYSLWLPARLICMGGLVVTAALLVRLMPRFLSGGTDGFMAFHIASITVGYFATLLIGSLATCFLVTRLFRHLHVGQLRSLNRHVQLLSVIAFVFTALGILIGAFCPFEKNGHFYGWSAHEVAGVMILAWDLQMMVTASRLKGRTSRVSTLMLIGIIGNVVVLAGWLGAIAIEQHGFMTGLPLLLLLVQLPIACTLLLPDGAFRRRCT